MSRWEGNNAYEVRCEETPQVWMHLQADWDLKETVRKRSAA
jgi:plasmid maintenance system antidote protein VapI